MSSRFSMEAVLSLTDNMTSQFRRATNQTTAMARSTTQQLTQMNAGVNRAIGGAVRGIGIAASAAAGGIALLAREASKIEDATARFTPLMGSVEKANELVAALNKTAATTPFQFENIADVANSLLPAMNSDIEKTVETFRMLGDTAGGNTQRLNSISAVYTRAVLKNKVEVGDLNMLVSAGIPIYGELAKTMGVTVEQMSTMVSQGKVTGDIMTQTFKNMTSEGGIFYNGMQIASETLTGKMSTLKDNLSLTAATIGTALIPNVKSGVDAITNIVLKVREWTENNKELISQKIEKIADGMKNAFKAAQPYLQAIVLAIKGLVAGFEKFKPLIKFIVIWFGAYVALTKAFLAFQVARSVFIAVRAFMALAKAQGVLNAVMAMNPIGLIVIAVAALVAGIIMMIKHWDKVKEKLLQVWNWFSRMLDNPFFIAVATIVAPWLTIPAMIIKHWEKIKTFFIGLYDWFMKMLDNPFFRNVALILAPWLTIPALIIKNWSVVKEFFTTFISGFKDGFMGAIDAIKGAFFTFADVILTMYGSVFNGIMKGAAAVGNFLGKDVSGINQMISNVEGMQANVREQSFIGGRNQGGQDQGQPAQAAQYGPTVAQRDQLAQNQRITEENRQRHDLYLHGPVGSGISETPGGSPERAINLGRQ